MNETSLMNAIRLELSSREFIVFRANVGTVKMPDGRYFNTGLPKGFSDLFAVKNGKVYFIEVKVHPNTPTPEQLNFLGRMRKQGCSVGVAYSVEEALQICS